MDAEKPYHRTYLEPREATAAELDGAYASGLLTALEEAGYRLASGDLEIRMPREFGFCWGVERALRMVHETRRRFPDRRLFLTSELIHNRHVNTRLREMGFHFLSGAHATFTYGDLAPGDVVVIPAFGAAVPIVEKVKASGATIIDTTCGEVINVWKQVRANAEHGFTSVIHGKPGHDETVATASRATGATDGFIEPRPLRAGKNLIVRDLDQARIVCDYIESGGDAAAFLAMFRGATSAGLDPDADLERIGIANQTTMLSAETLAIQALFRATLVRRYGEAELGKRLRAMDTICSATQGRQDALHELLAEDLDLLIVVGGYHSSNTGHLAELGVERGVPTFHIDDARCLKSVDEIRHKPIGKKDEEVATGWWPASSPRWIGLAAGASTPGTRIGEVILRVFDLAGVDPVDAGA